MKPSDIPIGRYYVHNDDWGRKETSHPIIMHLARAGWFKGKLNKFPDSSINIVNLTVHSKRVYAVSHYDPDFDDCKIPTKPDSWKHFHHTIYAHGDAQDYMNFDMFCLTKNIMKFEDGIHILHYKCACKKEYRKCLMTIKTGHTREAYQGIHWCPKEKKFRGLARYGYLVDLEEIENNYKNNGVTDALFVQTRRLKHQKNERNVVDNDYHRY